MTDVLTTAIGERLRAVRAPLGADEIMRMIPHRPPFVLLDRVTELDPPARAVGVKAVTMGEPWFAGHFPGMAIMPGVLVVECLAQLAGVLIAADCQGAGGQPPASSTDGPGVLAEIKHFRFRRRISPGDQLRLEAALSNKVGRAREFACTASVDGQRAAHGTLVIVA